LSYAATKAAVIALSEALREDLAPRGVGVSVLIPGGVRSRLWRTSRAVRGLPDTDTPPDDISGQSASAAGDPDEVGRLVVEAVRHNSAYIFTDALMLNHLEKRLANILAACRN
jgi:short-subunit dehydrogenase